MVSQNLNHKPKSRPCSTFQKESRSLPIKFFNPFKKYTQGKKVTSHPQISGILKRACVNSRNEKKNENKTHSHMIEYKSTR